MSSSHLANLHLVCPCTKCQALIELTQGSMDYIWNIIKFILNEYNTDYKTRLVKLHLLPLAMLYELNDICFFIKSLMQTSRSFNILDYVSFSRNNTRSGTHNKLVLPLSTSSRHKHFFFNRIPHLWNSLPPIDTTKELLQCSDGN